MRYFETKFLEEADEFISGLDRKTNDPKLFKKLQNDIWEFRTKYAGLQIRLFAFWDKRSEAETLIIATHGLIKKSGKTPQADLDKATRLRKLYLTLNVP